MALAKLFPPGTIPYKLGDYGPAVREIQISLGALGYPLVGTGFFGNSTDTAVTAFQLRAALDADGEVGPKTAAAIDRAIASNRAGVPASVKAEIATPLWYQVGVKLIGTKETPGSKDNKVIIQWAKDEGGSIARDYTHDSVPWCALGVNHCLTKAEIKGTETLWALDFDADAMQKRLGRRWPGVRLPGPAVGAIAPMLRDGGGHVMMVAGKDQLGRIMGLGFNQSDAVNIVPFAVSRLNHGYWWPKGQPLPKTGFANLPIVNSSGRVSLNEA